MSLKIKLQKNPYRSAITYRLVVTSSHKTPHSMCVDQIGIYNIHNKTLLLDKAKYNKWISYGVVPTNAVFKLLSKFEI